MIFGQTKKLSALLYTLQKRSVICNFLIILIFIPAYAFSLDMFSGEADFQHLPLDRANTEGICDKDKIAHPLYLSDVIDLVLCNNPQTRTLWAASRTQAAQIGISKAAYLPILSAQVGISQNLTTTAGQAQSTGTVKTANLTASYLLYDFGGRSASLENSRQLLVAANATRHASLQSLFLAAVQSYYGLLAAKATTKSYQAAESSAKESLAAAEARYKAGIATPVDKLQAQTTLSQVAFNRINAEGNERSVQGSLATLMGYDALKPFILHDVSDQSPDPVAEKDIGLLIEQARKDRPDLQAADAQIRAAEYQLEAVRATGRPVISLSAIAAFNDSTGQSSYQNNSLGITMSMPLFSGFKTHYQETAAQAQLDGKVAERDRLANQVALDVWGAYQALITASTAMRSADDLLAVATQSEKMILGRYKAGVGNILDTLSAQSALANARQQRATALYQFLINKFSLAYAMGKMDIPLTEHRN